MNILMGIDEKIGPHPAEKLRLVCGSGFMEDNRYGYKLSWKNRPGGICAPRAFWLRASTRHPEKTGRSATSLSS
jgi:hypothetical protein